MSEEKKNVSWLTIICIGGIALSMCFRQCSSWLKEEMNKTEESAVWNPSDLLPQEHEQTTIEQWQETYMAPSSASPAGEEQQ